MSTRVYRPVQDVERDREGRGVLQPPLPPREALTVPLSIFDEPVQDSKTAHWKVSEAA